MTPNEIESLRIAIAEECGWEIYERLSDIRKHDKHTKPHLFPPYTTSIDAIREAAMERFKEYKDRCLFDWHMANLSNISISYLQLTPLDWCIAFARTAKIWHYKQ